MYAVKAIYDGVNFKPLQPISIKGTHEVIITFLEPVTTFTDDNEIINKRPRSEIIGSLKGKIWMADDFNDPIDELKDYME